VLHRFAGHAAFGDGLRPSHEHGIFRQAIRDGRQVEEPDNLRRPDRGGRPSGQGLPNTARGTFGCGAAITVIPNRPSTLGVAMIDRSSAGALRNTPGLGGGPDHQSRRVLTGDFVVLSSSTGR
jgi:hypothetical protein